MVQNSAVRDHLDDVFRFGGANIDATADVIEDFARRVELYVNAMGFTDPSEIETLALKHVRDWAYEPWEVVQADREGQDGD